MRLDLNHPANLNLDQSQVWPLVLKVLYCIHRWARGGLEKNFRRLEQAKFFFGSSVLVPGGGGATPPPKKIFMTPLTFFHDPPHHHFGPHPPVVLELFVQFLEIWFWCWNCLGNV